MHNFCQHNKNVSSEGGRKANPENFMWQQKYPLFKYDVVALLVNITLHSSYSELLAHRFRSPDHQYIPARLRRKLYTAGAVSTVSMLGNRKQAKIDRKATAVYI
jgi:hypothetical protein